MRIARFLVLTAVLCTVACEATNQGHDEVRPPTNFQLLRNDFSPAPESRTHGAAMVSICCPKQLPAWRELPEVDAACRELQRVIESPHPYGAFDDWGARCFARIPTSSLLLALQRGEPMTREFSNVLAEMDPDNTTSTIMFSELVKRPRDREGWFGVDAFLLAEAMEVLADHELARLSKYLESEESGEVSSATYLLRGAAKHPLIIPELIERLRTHLSHPDRMVAEQAMYTLLDYESGAREAPDEYILHRFSLRVATQSIVSNTIDTRVGMKTRSNWKREVRLLLSRRLAFCSSRVATMILAAFRADGDPTDAYLAERAIEFRSRRCGTLTPREEYANDLPVH